MKKFLSLCVLVIIAIMGLAINNSYAETTLTTESIEVLAPEEGVYGVGQEVDIKFTFNKKIKGVMPKLQIYFGRSSDVEKIDVETNELTEFSSEVIYKYTIKSGDNGKLNIYAFKDPSQYPIQTEDEDSYTFGTINVSSMKKTIYADTTIKWVDLTNKEIKIKNKVEGDNLTFYLDLEGFTPNGTNSYYLRLSHQKENLKVKNADEVYQGYSDGTWQTSFSSNEISFVNKNKDIFAEKGDIYATICEIDAETGVPKIIYQDEKIEKKTLLPLTQRYSAFFSNDETTLLCWEYYGYEARKVNYKIGKITDTALINKIKNGDTASLNELLQYAKETNAEYTGTLELEKTEGIINAMNLKEDEYYFVYLSMDTQNDKYEAIEDVNVGKAVKSSDGMNLILMNNKDFKWNETIATQSDTAKGDKTTAPTILPDTGKELLIFSIILIITLFGIVGMVKYNKYKNIK